MNFFIANLGSLIQSIEQSTETVKRLYGHLDEEQINWRPSTDEWSIGEILEHLIITNSSYFEVFDKIIAGDATQTLFERIPIVPQLNAWLLIKAFEPSTHRKIPAPKVFLPTNKNLGTDIIQTFETEQRRVISYMDAGKNPSTSFLIDRIITSPASSWVTYSVLDAFRIMAVHETHHLVQMEQIAEMAAFFKDEHVDVDSVI